MGMGRPNCLIVFRNQVWLLNSRSRSVIELLLSREYAELAVQKDFFTLLVRDPYSFIADKYGDGIWELQGPSEADVYPAWAVGHL